MPLLASAILTQGSMHPPDPFRIAFIEPAALHTEPQLCQLLEFEGIAVSVFGPDDLHRLRAERADLVVLNQVRLRRSTFPIAAQACETAQPRPLTLALVGRGDELSGIELVERGIDAFIALPCGAREFVARVRALLRRTRRHADGTIASLEHSAGRPVQVSDLDIDPLRRRVRLKGHELRLTEQEFQLLYFLAGNPGRVFGRQALLDAVWGSDTFVTTRSVDALVKRLRQQLRTAGRPDSYVETVRGVGYRLTDSGFGASMSAA